MSACGDLTNAPFPCLPSTFEAWSALAYILLPLNIAIYDLQHLYLFNCNCFTYHAPFSNAFQTGVYPYILCLLSIIHAVGSFSCHGCSDPKYMCYIDHIAVYSIYLMLTMFSCTRLFCQFKLRKYSSNRTDDNELIQSAKIILTILFSSKYHWISSFAAILTAISLGVVENALSGPWHDLLIPVSFYSFSFISLFTCEFLIRSLSSFSHNLLLPATQSKQIKYVSLGLFNAPKNKKVLFTLVFIIIAASGYLLDLLVIDTMCLHIGHGIYNIFSSAALTFWYWSLVGEKWTYLTRSDNQTATSLSKGNANLSDPIVASTTLNVTLDATQQSEQIHTIEMVSMQNKPDGGDLVDDEKDRGEEIVEFDAMYQLFDEFILKSEQEEKQENNNSDDKRMPSDHFGDILTDDEHGNNGIVFLDQDIIENKAEQPNHIMSDTDAILSDIFESEKNLLSEQHDEKHTKLYDMKSTPKSPLLFGFSSKFDGEQSDDDESYSNTVNTENLNENIITYRIKIEEYQPVPQINGIDENQVIERDVYETMHSKVVDNELDPEIELELENIVNSYYTDPPESILSDRSKPQQKTMVQCPSSTGSTSRSSSESHKSSKGNTNSNKRNNSSSNGNHGGSMNGSNSGDDGDEKKQNNKRTTDHGDGHDETEDEEEDEDDEDKEEELEANQSHSDECKLNIYAASFNPNKHRFQCISKNPLETIDEFDGENLVKQENKANSSRILNLSLSLEPNNLHRGRGNIFISRKLTVKIIPAVIKQEIPHIYSFMDKAVVLMELDIDEGRVMYDIGDIQILNYDFHDKITNEILYCIIERQNELKNKNYKWKMLETLFTANDIQNTYPDVKLSELPKSPYSNCVFIHEMNHRHKIEDILQTESLSIISLTEWNKLDVYSKHNNKEKMCLYLTKQEFIKRIETAMMNNVNDLHLIPIILFNDPNDIIHAFVQVISLNDNVDIGISYQYLEHLNRMQVIGIHLDKEQILEQHQLTDPQHMSQCHCLDTFISNINAIKIGNLLEKDNKIKDLRKKNDGLKQKNQHLMEENKHLRNDKRKIEKKYSDLTKEMEKLRAQLNQLVHNRSSPSSTYSSIFTETQSNTTISNQGYPSHFINQMQQLPSPINSNQDSGHQRTHSEPLYLFYGGNQNTGF